MDKASLIGVLIGLVCLGIVFYEVSHGHFMMFYSLEGVLMVGGGSISVVLHGHAHGQASSACRATSAASCSTRAATPSKWCRRWPRWARRPAATASSRWNRRSRSSRRPIRSSPAGLRMAVDGVDPDGIEATLRMEVIAMQERHKAGKKFFDLIKLYGPGYGLVGTLVGQVGMFGNLATADIGTLGTMLAVAVVATMYGAIVANAIAGPIGDKLAHALSARRSSTAR